MGPRSTDLGPSELSERRPVLDARSAEELAARRFGLEGRACELPSERDRNFLVTGAGGERHVLKLAQVGEDPAVLDLQNAALGRLAASSLPGRFPRVVRDVEGEEIATVRDAVGRETLARVLTWVPGRPLAEVRPHSRPLLADLGRVLGELDLALEGLEHPALARELRWDLAHGERVVAAHAAGLRDAVERTRVERVLAALADRRAALGRLPRALVHNDANDHNVLVDDRMEGQRVAGLVDFGDCVRTWRAAEVAVAAAYAMLGKRDPLGALAAVAGGYHAVNPLAEEELEALFPLVRLRLAVSVSISAHQKRLEPENGYLRVSEAPAWELLARLEQVPESLALAHTRAACDLEPFPGSPAVRSWLAGTDLAPLVAGVDLGAAPLLDLSMESADLAEHAVARALAEPGAPEVLDLRARGGHAAAFGRWLEPRELAAGKVPDPTDEDGLERCTIHLGADLYLPVGTPLQAPLAGRVERAIDRRSARGPTVVLEHEPAPGVRFFTIYGHLARESVAALRPGQAVAAGEAFARVGTPAENGGSAPHAHVQLALDLLGEEGEFPGACAPRERAVWTSVSPDPGLLLGLPAGHLSWVGDDPAELAERRRRVLGPSLSLSYDVPVHVVRGRGVHLVDQEGRVFLDAVNNVPTVGHSHPRVVRAAQRQTAVLNTNTRYLHRGISRYAERLVATLPEPLEVCYFVNSGSEANELARRLVETATGGTDWVVLEAGYHGNTTGTVELSHYKLAGPGGHPPGPCVRVAALPDVYRGRFRDDPGAAALYADSVRACVERSRSAGRRLAGFLAEPLVGCGGQIVPPPGYFRAAYEHVRAAGGLVVADEVQVGFGRAGTHFWAFETHGVVPDVVTMGKPIGNGHPLGAVVTTRAVAEAFANGMELFNTFGGNPVSMAVGEAVLDVIEDEGLQENARAVGEHLLAGLRALTGRHALAGDARGVGLYLGLELVLDREARTPAPAAAAYVANRLRRRGVLVSTDGPDHDVLKIKPPLVFSRADADRLVDELDAVLGETALG